VISLSNKGEIELGVLFLFVISDQGALDLLVVYYFVHSDRCRVNFIINGGLVRTINESVIIHVSKDISPILSALNQIIRFMVCTNKDHAQIIAFEACIDMQHEFIRATRDTNRCPGLPLVHSRYPPDIIKQ
jgi:hypothetical protein